MKRMGRRNIRERRRNIGDSVPPFYIWYSEVRKQKMVGTYALYLLENGQTLFHNVAHSGYYLASLDGLNKLGEGSLTEIMALVAGLV